VGENSGFQGPENAKKFVLSSVLLAALNGAGRFDYITKNNDAKYGKQYRFI
jgi:hypothetical protein